MVVGDEGLRTFERIAKSVVGLHTSTGSYRNK